MTGVLYEFSQAVSTEMHWMKCRIRRAAISPHHEPRNTEKSNARADWTREDRMVSVRRAAERDAFDKPNIA